jgi:hypothetical protein
MKNDAQSRFENIGRNLFLKKGADDEGRVEERDRPANFVLAQRERD